MHPSPVLRLQLVVEPHPSVHTTTSASATSSSGYIQYTHVLHRPDGHLPPPFHAPGLLRVQTLGNLLQVTLQEEQDAVAHSGEVLCGGHTIQYGLIRLIGNLPLITKSKK
jgi:hypothetical protein